MTVRVRRGVAVLAVGLIGALLAPAGSAQAASKPPLVKIDLKGTTVKLTGAKHLKPGWVRFQINTPDEIWFYTPLHGLSAKAAHASQGIRAKRKGAVADTTGSDRAATRAKSASAARAGQDNLFALGGSARDGNRTSPPPTSPPGLDTPI